jgi:hypothetical protein
MVNSYPLYFLRACNGCIFGIVSWKLANINSSSGIYGFGLLVFISSTVTGTILSECICFSQSSRRGCYTTIPAIGTLNFMFSGTFIKPGSLEKWMQYWAPSISFYRWAVQANVINVYQNDTEALAQEPINIYAEFLSLFGWGGKTKWYCLYMVLAFIAIFRTVSCFTSGVAARARHSERRGATSLPE